jgi:site-specific DNA-methyltransferase (adenine-specific)
MTSKIICGDSLLEVIDPFCGSGSTGVACQGIGLSFTGIEITHVYAEIARKRLSIE